MLWRMIPHRRRGTRVAARAGRPRRR
jgi:hypothetical protein